MIIVVELVSSGAVLGLHKPIDAHLFVLLFGQPELRLVFHNVGQHCAADEHHVLSSGRVFDSDLEFLQTNQPISRPNGQSEDAPVVYRHLL